MNEQKFEYSLVAFVPNTLKDFFDGTIDEATFKKIFSDNLKTAKVYLILMSQELLDESKKVFCNEFLLTDKINAAINREKLSGEKLKDTLRTLIAQYDNENLT